jgi:hypothetical protein
VEVREYEVGTVIIPSTLQPAGLKEGISFEDLTLSLLWIMRMPSGITKFLI